MRKKGTVAVCAAALLDPPRQLVTESEQHIRLFAEFNKTATVPFFLMGKVFSNVRAGAHRDAIYSTC